MKPYLEDRTVRVFHGDCLDVLRELPDASVDAVVTDPPYGLGFMGKAWDDAATQGAAARLRADGDHAANPFKRSRAEYGGASYGGDHAVAMRAFGDWCEQWAAECLRILKPGGHMLAFGGTRTWHRLACAVEDAGFEVRDSIAWLYGSGFPKSLDVSKAIDKAAGAEREVVGFKPRPDGTSRNYDDWAGAAGSGGTISREGGDWRPQPDTAPATPDAERWQGWGTALKPAHEPIVVARKPLAGTVSQNVLAHGTGALNVDGCRVDGVPRTTHVDGNKRTRNDGPTMREGFGVKLDPTPAPAGRWPPNVVLDESQAAALDAQSGSLTSGLFKPEHADNGKGAGTYGAMGGRDREAATYGDTGGASRFMYVAKADSGERIRLDGTAHPTVKPLALMRWLVRLVTPPGGTVLEPFAGSGTTVEACILEGFRCIAVEREADYLPLIRQRIHRRRDPVAAVKATGDDGGLFDLLGEEPA